MKRTLLSLTITVTVATLALVAVPADAGTVFTDLYDTSVNTNNINSGIAARTFGEVTVTGYNEAGSAWQTQLRTDNGGVLMLAPRDSPGQPRVWVGPDHDFLPELGQTYEEYTIVFDVDPSDYGTAWAGFTFGVNAANQGAHVTNDHGGLSVRFWENDNWEIFDGTDGSATAVASGNHVATDYRTVRLDVTDSGAAVAVELSIDGVSQASYTYTGTFAGNYLAFSAFTDNSDSHSSSLFDNFNILPSSPYVWTDPYDTSAHANDINAGIYDRAAGQILVTSYNEAGATWQTQLRSDNGGVLLLAPNTSANDKVWAGPDYDFLAELGQTYKKYTIGFDVDPNDHTGSWAAFTFGVTAGNQGEWPDQNHGGLSLLLRENDTWVLFDGTDGSAAAAASGSHAATDGFRTVLLNVWHRGATVTVELSIDGVSQTSYTYTGSFAANYMAFVAYTDAAETDSSHFDNFSLMPVYTRGTIFVIR